MSKDLICDLLTKCTDIKIYFSPQDVDPSTKYILIKNDACFDKMFQKGELGTAESYMDGDWESNDLEYVLYTILDNHGSIVEKLKSQSWWLFYAFFVTQYKRFFSKNTLITSKQNIKMHYDVGNDLYEKMLGQHMQYTCAYFHRPDMTLDEAQEAKMALIAKKLDLQPGMKVLDIGCGFGHMVNYIATRYDVQITGINISEAQLSHAKANFSRNNVRFLLQDYRDVDEKYDRIYSIGMIEHVGKANYPVYFDKCFDCLNDDGLILVHTITYSERLWISNETNSFIMKYIFPESELPHVSDFLQAYNNRWQLEDFQNFGMSYAKTLRSWRKNIGNWEGLDEYDERFRKMWNFYLQEMAAMFHHKTAGLGQFVFTKKLNKRPDDCHHIRA